MWGRQLWQEKAGLWYSPKALFLQCIWCTQRISEGEKRGGSDPKPTEGIEKTPIDFFKLHVQLWMNQDSCSTRILSRTAIKGKHVPFQIINLNSLYNTCHSWTELESNERGGFLYCSKCVCVLLWLTNKMSILCPFRHEAFSECSAQSCHGCSAAWRHFLLSQDIKYSLTAKRKAVTKVT